MAHKETPKSDPVMRFAARCIVAGSKVALMSDYKRVGALIWLVRSANPGLVAEISPRLIDVARIVEPDLAFSLFIAIEKVIPGFLANAVSKDPELAARMEHIRRVKELCGLFTPARISAMAKTARAFSNPDDAADAE